MVIQALSKSMSRVFGSRNDRVIKKYRARAAAVLDWEPKIRPLTDAEITEKTVEFNRRHVDENEEMADMLPEVMAVAREAMDRSVGIRNAFNPEHRSKFAADKLSPEMRSLWEELCAKADAITPRPVLGGDPAPGHLLVDVPNAFYDAVREIYDVSRPPFRARPFDVQIIGAMVLSEGRIAEMRTGEGKTIVAPLACYPACIEGMQGHVVTVNDYLVQRDRDWVFPFYLALGLNVGAIHPHHQQPPQMKGQAYMCNVVYGTNSEFGFDYLRDNMKENPAEQVQKRRDFCIVDEIDSILIDEARTPLIISGPAHADAPRYELADRIARHLFEKQRQWDAKDKKFKAAELRAKGLEGDIRNARDKSRIKAMRAELKELQAELPELEADRDTHPQYYEVEPERKAAHVTHEGIAEAQKIANIGSFYVGDNIDFPHLLTNAVRAHTVYKRDQQYVVQGGEVVIVDEFTGRLMVGRQWSDGLHQAVEQKEKVKVKEETQTLATVTIQNYFKLYDRLAGMTGTAITEATEFGEIYKLDVVSIPTNRPIQRTDREDLIFLSEKDKWNAIVDEVERVHNLGRPVLVGTTSVDKSEMLSELLRKRHGIKHEVLNAKAEHAEREGNIVEDAGHLAAVMIATNMAGRGTDIKLQPISRDMLLEHWKKRDMIPAAATVQMSDDQLVAMSYRHQAVRALGISKSEAEAVADADLRLRLFRHWAVQDAFVEEKKAAAMTLEQCVEALDGIADYQRHRLEVFPSIERMGGLHIVGTERHESRRIDNQLRGRAGRQGDRGSSRFFISLEDDLMKQFAGDKTKYILSKLGMKEGDAIEHGMVSRSVERAQRKVEERNYEIRKNLLEYDEVMEFQRNDFYKLRQSVIEGRKISETVHDYLSESVDDAADRYLAKDYTRTQVAEWCLAEHDISVDPARIQLHTLHELEEIVRRSAKEESMALIDMTVDEYLSMDTPTEDWDFAGVQAWAKSKLGVHLDGDALRQMNPTSLKRELGDRYAEVIDAKDLTGLEKFIDTDPGRRDLAGWMGQQFGVEVPVEELSDKSAEEARRVATEKVEAAYRQREIDVPCEAVVNQLLADLQSGEQNQAGLRLLGYAKIRLREDWKPEDINGKTPQDIFEKLRDSTKAWLEPGGKLEQEAKEIGVKFADDEEGLAKWVKERHGAQLHPEAFEQARKDAKEAGEEGRWAERMIERIGRDVFRGDLTRLERYVLLQIIDQAWKDHLYAMDSLKNAVGMRGYAEKDPRIEYKREGANLYNEMQGSTRNRVAELVFRAKLQPQQMAPRRPAGPAPVQGVSAAAVAEALGIGTETEAQKHGGPELEGDETRVVDPAAAAATPPLPEPDSASAQPEAEAASPDEKADEGGEPGMTRKQRRAKEAEERRNRKRDA
ncbi:preprotein translocase subunit SecA [Phycisphaera mikurensis]|uniref:Protein translocase subunit SecA n=1 Tax=Phycisphaera mikurensis (strain NBRC 102666 / KCTC 22515 / FYK2301M01) TaxID=1142394 RepID=I0IEP4_PHYMF|nr:preprotein translocase subunit SecA [Phycisphaera mikurensis]MBB6441529.1 preprotein translocase subunit SecA [Phycisphaera mikurensis]BAM03732.1 protein translocase subunit SecA [Phycisphaera mikurensis NBRC 102666]